MALLDTLDWQEFVTAYPGMRLWPQQDSGLGFKGFLAFTAAGSGIPEVTDEYELTILVPSKFPREIPRVRETAGRIPLDGKHHINGDGTLCLGTPLRLLMNLSKQPTLVGFAGNCLVPYLYAMSRNLKEETPFCFGELPHGTPGETSDYGELLGLKGLAQVRLAVRLLGMRERHANKEQCPCGCGRRLGCCEYRFKLSKIRELASLEWFRTEAFK
jgi:hypothetical protein